MARTIRRCRSARRVSGRRSCRVWGGSGGRMRRARGTRAPTGRGCSRGRACMRGGIARDSTTRRSSCGTTAASPRARTTWKAHTVVSFLATSTTTGCPTPSTQILGRRWCRPRGTRPRRGRRRRSRPTPPTSPPRAATPLGRPRAEPTPTGGSSRSASRSTTGARGPRSSASAASPLWRTDARSLPSPSTAARRCRSRSPRDGSRPSR